ncbi:unnamed protein product [Umbelopsis sp. WA50703]
MAEQGICEDCVTGFLKSGKTTGEIKEIGSVQAYFAPSTNHTSDKAIVVISDIFGWEFVNARLYADELAKQTGFLVVLPDLMKGYAFSTDVLQKPTGIVQSIVQKAKFAGLIYSFGILRLNLKDKDVLDSGLAVIQDLRSNYGIQSIGVHGNRGPEHSAAPVQAYAAGHPSLLSVPGDFTNLDPNLPGFYQLAESDMMVTEKTRGQIEELTKDMNFKIKMYPGTKHGFCLKSNEDDENERNIAAEATKDAAEFFRASL